MEALHQDAGLGAAGVGAVGGLAATATAGAGATLEEEDTRRRKECQH